MSLRKILPVLLFTLCCSAAFSQTQKGNLVVSGKTDLNFLFSKTVLTMDSIVTGSTKSNQYGFTVGIGYFIADNFSIGLSGTYSYNYIEIKTVVYEPTITGNITQAFTILPQLNYYFPLEGKLKPFIGIGVGYLWLEERDSRVSDNHNKVYSLSGTSFSGAAGLSYFINRSVALDLGVQYAHNKLKDKMNERAKQKENAVAGILGVSVYF